MFCILGFRQCSVGRTWAAGMHPQHSLRLTIQHRHVRCIRLGWLSHDWQKHGLQAGPAAGCLSLEIQILCCHASPISLEQLLYRSGDTPNCKVWPQAMIPCLVESQDSEQRNMGLHYMASKQSNLLFSKTSTHHVQQVFPAMDSAGTA
jgi:hypothetical protein